LYPRAKLNQQCEKKIELTLHTRKSRGSQLERETESEIARGTTHKEARKLNLLSKNSSNQCIMGNIPARAMSFPHESGKVTVSTRSVPPDDFIVQRDVRIVVCNSGGFTRNSGEQERMMEVLKLARAECARLGGNYVLGAHFEIKQFGEHGSWMCYTLTGMACVVVPKPQQQPQQPAVSTSSNQYYNASAPPTIQIATASAVLPAESYEPVVYS
jgi:hypothetical protein